MRNRLQLADATDERNGYGFVLTVCAPRTDSGVSTLAQALAESFTVAGMQTLLVDADLGEAALSRRLELTEIWLPAASLRPAP